MVMFLSNEQGSLMHIQYVTSVKGRELQIGYICYSVISHFYSSNHIIMEDVKAFIGHLHLYVKHLIIHPGRPISSCQGILPELSSK